MTTAKPDRSADASGSAEQQDGAGPDRSVDASGSAEQPKSYSTRSIAKMMSTSQSTVARMGRELALQRMEEGKPVAYITGLDGKMYPASQFDRNGMVNALVEAMKADPDASLRSIASKAGCSPATVLRYRRWFDESGRLDEWRSADADDSAEHDETGR